MDDHFVAVIFKLLEIKYLNLHFIVSFKSFENMLITLQSSILSSNGVIESHAAQRNKQVSKKKQSNEGKTNKTRMCNGHDFVAINFHLNSLLLRSLSGRSNMPHIQRAVVATTLTATDKAEATHI